MLTLKPTDFRQAYEKQVNFDSNAKYHVIFAP